MQGKEEDWRVLAQQKQLLYHQTLGSRPHDEIQKSDLFHLKKKVGFATCGTPENLPSKTNFFTGYNEEQLPLIVQICNQIIKKSDRDPILFGCIFLILHYKEKISETPVFRVKTSNNTVFIDVHARVYSTWTQFKEENSLPDCEYCSPLNGSYHTDKKGLLALDFAFSPASTLASKTIDGLDTAGSVVSIGAAAILGASVFTAVAPAAIAAAGVATVSSGVYGFSRSVYSLVDRKKHEQSVGIENPESRAAWMTIASSTVGMGTTRALAEAQKMVEAGKSLSKMSLLGLQALNATSVIFSGFGFVDTFINCYDKYNKGVLSRKDVFDLSCEMLFLFNAVVATRATHDLINNMNVAVNEAPIAQKKLTKTQKRNLRKRNAKRRAKGLITRNPTEAEDTSEKPASAMNYSPILMKMAQLAAEQFAPRLSEIANYIESVSHDLMCWRKGDIKTVDLLLSLSNKFFHLWKKYREDVENVFMIVLEYFKVIVDDVMRHFMSDLFENATDEQQQDFCTRIISMEDHITTTIDNLERENLQLEEEIGNDNTEGASENNDDDTEVVDNSLNNDDSDESKDVFKACVKLIRNSSLCCSNLQELGYILHSVQLFVIEEFKKNMSNYFELVKKEKEQTDKKKNFFDLKKFNSCLEIKGDVVQHMFEMAMNDVNAANVDRIKNKSGAIENKYATGVPVWEAVSEGVFHCFRATNKGHLSETELLSLVKGFLIRLIEEKDCQSVDKLTTDHCEIFKNQNTVMVDVKLNEEKKAQVVVYCEQTLDDIASMMIFVFI